jgi:hypothetical protein
MLGRQSILCVVTRDDVRSALSLAYDAPHDAPLHTYTLLFSCVGGCHVGPPVHAVGGGAR